MTIWSVSPVNEIPEITLSNWFIAETDKKQRHFVGYNVTGSEGRVSSAIVQFDSTKRMGITMSGRVYQLEGNPGYDEDAMYTWHGWCAFNGVQSWENVTGNALAETQSE